MKPWENARGWWIFKGTSNFCQELEVSELDFNTLKKSRPDGFYDIVSDADTVDGGIHVVERSALDAAVKRIEELENAIKNEIQIHSDSALWNLEHASELLLREAPSHFDLPNLVKTLESVCSTGLRLKLLRLSINDRT